eukprot:TRINITY_DN20958_c0_g1_i1.p1 TRINITY_DN20958_c0_g1~~TRINITY_DN20958_c0_g1_i1.p1  ORF type:complete len:490 (-),score=138.83 TRINITY_DN20958_c0_g1_i1:149-1438(-)
MDEEMSLKLYMEEQALIAKEKEALLKDEALAKALAEQGTPAAPILVHSGEIPKPLAPLPAPTLPPPKPSPYLPPPKSPFAFLDGDDLESLRLARQIEEEDRLAALALEESERLAQQLQQEEQRRLEQEKSERLARQLQKEWEDTKAQKENLLRDDAMLALLLQEEEEEAKKKAHLASLQEDDMLLAMEIDKAENTFEEDRLLALKIQKEEEEKKKKYTPPPPVYVAPPTPMPYIPFLPRHIQHARLPEPEPQKMAQFSELSKYFKSFDVLKQLLQTYPGGEVRRVIKPQLQERFEKKLESLQKRYGANSVECSPRIAFHGTKSARMASIEQKGLLVPGSSGVSHATDSGWYGRGIYLSPNAGVSMGYSDDGRVIICAVLMGKVYKCPGRMDGAGLVPGMDSHESPCGQEYIVFSPDQILPLFVLSTRKY